MFLAIYTLSPGHTLSTVLGAEVGFGELLILSGAGVMIVGAERLQAKRRGLRRSQDTARAVVVAGLASLGLAMAAVGVGQMGLGLDAKAVWIAALGATFVAYYTPRAVPWNPAPAVRRRVIIVGSGPRALRAWREMGLESGENLELLGFIDSNPAPAHPSVESRMLGRLEDLERILMTQVVDEVLIALPVKSRYAEIQSVITTCERMGTESKYPADIFDCVVATPRYETTGDVSLVSMKVTIEGGAAKAKRVMDVIGAVLGLILFSPLFVLIAIAIKLSSSGPVFFIQERYGQNKRPFRMYKFRTMRAGAEILQASLESLNEARGPVFKIRLDPRVTPVGRFLRRSSLDELPQLVNVLRGEMSLVGPRPLPTRDVLRFEESWLMRRFSIRPGMTGVWQVNGRSDIPFDDSIVMDLQYIDKWSIPADLRILAQTVPAVLTGRGAR